MGAHHFEVAAIGAGNVVDPAPARRDFAINDKKTDVQTCGFDPLLAAGTRKLVEPYICDISSDDEVILPRMGVLGIPGGAICTTIPDWDCPLGARCTLKTVAAFAHDDTNVFWTMGTQRDTSPYVDIKSVDCDLGYTLKRCQVSESVTFLGQPTQLAYDCWAGEKKPQIDDVPPPPGSARYGDDNARILECKGTLTIEAAIPLATQTIPGGGQIFVPSGGSLTVTPGGSKSRAPSRPARQPRSRPSIRRSRRPASSRSRSS